MLQGQHLELQEVPDGQDNPLCDKFYKEQRFGAQQTSVQLQLCPFPIHVTLGSFLTSLFPFLAKGDNI